MYDQPTQIWIPRELKHLKEPNSEEITEFVIVLGEVTVGQTLHEEQTLKTLVPES